MKQKPDFSILHKLYPTGWMSRAAIVSSGLGVAKTLANKEALGKGIKGKIHIGKKAFYPVESVITYLEDESR